MVKFPYNHFNGNKFKKKEVRIMKKIILSLSILLSLSSFAQEKYQVEVEPAVKLNQSILSDYNSQIEKEVGRIY